MNDGETFIIGLAFGCLVGALFIIWVSDDYERGCRDAGDFSPMEIDGKDRCLPIERANAIRGDK